MQFPYGLSDFSKIILGGYFYQDRTGRIPLLEAAGDQLIFIRPRRFGKSLLLSMLEHYYDLNRADQFEALFGSLAIGQNPTRLHNQYFVMKWDFSLVEAQGEVKKIEAALHRHLNDCIEDFTLRCQAHLTHPIRIESDNALSGVPHWWPSLKTPRKLCLLIDEYDNFANDVLMTGCQQADYEALLYGEGVLKSLFKAVKAGVSRGIDRVFITGVSPVVLSDRTSGYHIGEDIVFPPEKRTSRTTPALRATPP
jgi:hypothetical protein